MLTQYIIRTSSNEADESPDAGAIQGTGKNHSPTLSDGTAHTRVTKPGWSGPPRPVTPVTALGCCVIVVSAMLGCCLLAGVAGLAIAGAVLIGTALSVGDTMVRLKRYDVTQDVNQDMNPYDGVPSPPRNHGDRVLPGSPDVRPEPSYATSFWGALSTTEKRAFGAMAEERSFARGATLLREGGTADHVVLIQAGWTKICVNEQGRETVIAERGPGQLVGERAALQVNVRSASVVALEKVHALVMRTEDFADFVGTHPRVLDIVESQVYSRLTEPQGPSRQRCHHGHPVRTGGPMDDRSPRTRAFHGEHCTIVFTDVAGFGADVRNDEDRLIVREELLTMVSSAFTESGIPWDACHSEDRGDGLMIIIPARIPTKAVLDGLPGRLAEALKHHNRRSSEAVRIQLRLAVHVGPVTTDEMGLAGEAIIRTARLVEAPVLKRAIAKSSAHLGVIASTFVYENVIRHVDPDGFEPVRVTVKESRLDAWMRLSGAALTS
jgi:hypothetical protein